MNKKQVFQGYYNNQFVPSESDRLKELNGSVLAGFKPRFYAFLIDLVLSLIIFLMLSIPVGLLLQKTGVIGDELILKFSFKNWYSLVVIVLYFSLFTFWGKGQTPGKKLMRIRVVSLVHGHLSLWHCMERALGYAASTLEFGFGFVQFFIHPNRRTVHDRIAETIVVVVSKKKAATVPKTNSGKAT